MKSFVALALLLLATSASAYNANESSVEAVRFVKTHKTGTVTIDTWLWRRAYCHRERVVDWNSKHEGSYILNHPHLIRGAGRYSDLTEQMVRMVPDTIRGRRPRRVGWLTAVREPIDREISAHFFFGQFPAGLDTRRYEQMILERIRKRAPVYRMHADLRIDARDSPRQRRELEDFERRFDIVVTERFDESMAMVAQLYNWPLSDVAYGRANSCGHESRWKGNILACPPKDWSDEFMRKLNASIPDVEWKIYRIGERKLDAHIFENSESEVDFYKDVAVVESYCRTIAEHCKGGAHRKQKMKSIATLPAEPFPRFVGEWSDAHLDAICHDSTGLGGGPIKAAARAYTKKLMAAGE